MTQEDRELLLRDLCGRLPYKPMIYLEFQPGHGYQIGKMEIRNFWDIIRHFEGGIITTIKPYLRPMSSITEEERKEYKSFIAFSGNPVGSAEFIDWLNAHHLDYRGLISMGLAIEVTEENNPYKD